MLSPDCTCTKYGQRMSKNIQLHLWAVLSLAATGYPVRNVLLLVADDAGLEVSQNFHVISWWTVFCLVPLAHFLLCCQLAEKFGRRSQNNGQTKVGAARQIYFFTERTETGEELWNVLFILSKQTKFKKGREVCSFIDQILLKILKLVRGQSFNLQRQNFSAGETRRLFQGVATIGGQVTSFING